MHFLWMTFPKSISPENFDFTSVSYTSLNLKCLYPYRLTTKYPKAFINIKVTLIPLKFSN